MTRNEWNFVKRLVLVLLLIALFPLAALAYRLVFVPDAAGEMSSALAGLYALIPGPTSVAPTPTSSALLVVVPNGWHEHAVSDQNFAIALPAKWQRLPTTTKELDAVLQMVRQGNAELATALGASGPQLIQNGVKFWAFDFDADALKNKFVTNVTLTRRSLSSPISFETYVLVNLNQLEQLASRQGTVSHQRVTLANLPAEKIRYNLSSQTGDGATITGALTLYLLLNGNDAYVLTYATPLDQLSHYATTFDQSAATFRLLGQGQ